jgi:cellulose synthase/poly-beta-1,6-N-acetylglucosamine synthase-like glycosyltransferase
MVDSPEISVIVPCYNEQATIHLLLQALYEQTYQRAKLEVLIADGMSSDATRASIAAFQQAHPGLVIRVIDNPRRIIPAGLNRALEAAQGEYIVRLDAHSIPQPDYLERCVQALKDGRGSNVGGRWDIQPGSTSWAARSIAAAAAHPLGAGDARYRYGTQAGAVDTVPFGAYQRELVERIGAYDETLLTNEDYEFNVRIRQAGGTIWFDPHIRTVYFARATFGALARQYWRYGYWKLRMLLKHPQTLRWRQALPAFFVAGLLIGGGLGLWLPGVLVGLAAVLGLYLFVLLLAGLQAAFRQRSPGLVLGLPLAIALMHVSWGAAFWWSLITLPFRRTEGAEL